MHDAAYLGLPKSIDRLSRSQYVDRIEIYRRSPSGSKEIERIDPGCTGRAIQLLYYLMKGHENANRKSTTGTSLKCKK